ncbi:MAG TPA: aldehyde dehydrogenase family protein [Vicinamibacterales bacterium]|nr:aldehyde dehydrogenase family protein [Acidobacteriota bacterium]HOC17464.1 aldehyde dehydrogenase family protein [Vicinamibacterales bacterium]
MDPYQQYADDIVGRAAAAAEAWRRFDQAQADAVVEAMAAAAWEARENLARLAVDETQMGVFGDKVLKNAWAAAIVRDSLRGTRTAGVIAQDEASGITEFAEPVGAVLGLVPVTNPTSTAIFKALVCAKTRNALIFSPHRGARKCVRETARILSEAATGAGAPEDAIQVVSRSQTEYLRQVMVHKRLALIVATGTRSIVEAARHSGTPTLGVGPGNVPVYVHGSADLAEAARRILLSKTFDNGTVCASEQAVVVESPQAAALREAFERGGAHFCSAAEVEALGPVCFEASHRRMRADVVGQPAAEIARRAGFRVPARTRLLVGAPGGIGPSHPLSAEILAPVLAWYEVRSYAEALRTCRAITAWGGVGHTVGVHARDESVVADFAQMRASRVLVNQPTTQGAIGGIVNGLQPSLTLSCGPSARNLTTDNIGARHLLNIHRVVLPRANPAWAELTTGPADRV